MATATVSTAHQLSGTEEHVGRLLDRAAAIRLPTLFADPPADRLYHVAARGGVSVVALRTRSLTDSQLVDILTYRLAQYLSAKLVDPSCVCRQGLQCDPLPSVSREDLHIVAGAATTGRILCYLALRTLDTSPAATVRTSNRPRFPVEEHFGHDVLERLALPPDMPVSRVVEISRFVKNQELATRDERAVRSPAETVLAMCRVLCDAPRTGASAAVGSMDVTVGGGYFNLFHIPVRFLRQTAQPAADDGFLGWAARSRDFSPFAFLVGELARQHGRLDRIEDALALPGDRGVQVLLTLRRSARTPRSSAAPDTAGERGGPDRSDERP